MTDPSPITVAPLLKDADDAGYMCAALELARQGWDAGEVPVGALVVCGGEIVGRGCFVPNWDLHCPCNNSATGSRH